MTEWIAERRLRFVKREGAKRGELLIRVGRPYAVDPKKVNFQVAEGTAGCEVEILGLEKEYRDHVYGADP